jgi:WD40 repeat protein/transcriptional regulator with XRE-family HTH domain
MPVSSAAIALDQFTTFGDLLKYLRRRAGLTQRELSIAVGYSDAQISRLEQNERLPDLATITARFIPALHAEDQPEVAARLLELAAAVRREDAPAAGLPPYKGLYYFDESDAELFFGREELTETLVNHVNTGLKSDQRFLAVVGASGSGKSSVVRAGLIPALRWRQPSSGWPVYVLTPTAHPLDVLAASLQGDTKRGTSLRKFVDELVRQPQALSSAFKRIAEDTGAAHTLLVVDQFEELFTLCRSEAEQAAFVENLLTAALQPDGIAIIIIVLRADFYVHCARFDLLRQALSKYQEYIGPMTVEELRRAIEEPARRGHWELEGGLVEFLLHDVGADPGHAPEPGALPLLSHALLATWQRRRGHKLTLSGYTASGGIRGAIAETAEAVFHDQLEPEQRVIARQIFLRLTELGDDTTTADTRRRVSFDELASRSEDRDQVHEVLMTLADARLIITDQNAAEVAHEALIREWPTLRNWIDENREGLRLHRHLTDAAQEWESMGRDPGCLYRGARLAQALEWSNSHRDDLNILETSFLEASQALANQEAAEREAQRQRELETVRKLAENERARAEEQTQSNRRLKQRAVYLAIAFIIVGVLALVASAFGQRATRAEHLATSRELAAASVNNLQVDPERSVLLALQALDEVDTLEARNALHRALPELHLLLTIPVHSGGVPDVTFSPDGTRLASINDDGTTTLWDAHSGEQLITLKNEDSYPSTGVPRSIAFSPDGKTLATSDAIEVILWDASNGERLFSLAGQSIGTTTGYNLGVGQISFSPDGELLAVANMDGISKVWELASQTEVLSFESGTQPAKAIAYSPDGRLLATGGDEGIVKIWNAESGEELFALSLGGIIHSIAFGPEGDRLTAASEDGSVKIWDSGTGQELLSLPRLSGMYDIAFLSDGNLVTAGQDGTARVWDSTSGQQLLTLAGHSSTIIGVAGSPDGKRIATSGYDGTLKLWDATPGRELLTIQGHADIVWGVEYSPDGKRIASASTDGSARLWDAESGQLSLELAKGNSPTDGFTSLAFSPDGEQLATGGLDGTVTLWDSQSGNKLLTLSGHNSLVFELAFSPDGTRLASAAWDGTARVWDLLSGKEITTFSGHVINSYISGITFSADGKHVFTGADDKFVRIWDAATGQELGVISGEGKELYGVVLSPDGNLLAVSNQDGVITLWDANSLNKIRTLVGHAGLVNRLAFNKDGTRLASSSFDRLAKVWDVVTGEELVSLYGNTVNVFGVSFSPDGNHLATAGADGTVRTYTLRLNDLVDLARSRVTRSLADEECRTFLHMDSCP